MHSFKVVIQKEVAGF